MYIIKAKTKGFTEDRPIIKHIFAADQKTAMMKFKAEYDKEENIDLDQVAIKLIKKEEIK